MMLEYWHDAKGRRMMRPSTSGGVYGSAARLHFLIE